MTARPKKSEIASGSASETDRIVEAERPIVLPLHIATRRDARIWMSLLDDQIKSAWAKPSP
jgi:hypothetical protein